jgi:hypothetical protein
VGTFQLDPKFGDTPWTARISLELREIPTRTARRPHPRLAVAAPDLESALLLAVNHGGDSDSTGAITGNLLAAIHGERAIPRRWLDALELREEIERMANELYAACG